MEESTYRQDKTGTIGSMTVSDTIIPELIKDLESGNINLHVPALRRLLDIILDHPGNNELLLQNKIISVMNKFAENIIQNEEYALSTTIVHLIGVRGIIEDKAILAEAATEPLIRMIHQCDEKMSKCGSKSLGELIEENEIIRHSLLSTGFAQIVLHTLSLGTQSQSSSSSSQKDLSVPIHVKNGLLDVLLKLMITAEELKAISILIPILEQLKTNGEQELKNKAKKLLNNLSAEGISASSSSSSKEKEEKIQQLLETNKQKDEEIRREREEKERFNQELLRELQERLKERQEKLKERQEKLKERQEKEKEKKRANEAESKILIVEKEKNKLNQEIAKLKEEILKLKPKPIQEGDFPIAIINSDPTDFDFADIDGKQKKITKKLKKANSVSLTQVLENGTWELEVQFSNGGETGGIGIVKDAYAIPAGVSPRDSPHKDNMAVYTGYAMSGGTVFHKGNSISGNKTFFDNQIIKAEYDSEKGTLIFFVNEVQQPVYVTGIKEKVRFIIYMYLSGATCTIRSLKKLATPTSGHVANEKTLQW
ncbi:MAG: hypothetical protein EZS28_023037 [Streblomastix strix]|uniref:B30.2/SPRY domain-containing protein n=1 Tax=Streblomastix strix TaxID=222440 RepID=A0A5J4VFT1_9EUKA|nr:MAG: hypothetical protein EZS28_023037 [Streblomastix strix]